MVATSFNGFLTFLSRSFIICGFDFQTYFLDKRGNTQKAMSKLNLIYFMEFLLFYSYFTIFGDYMLNISELLNSELMNGFIQVSSRGSLILFIPMKITKLFMRQELYRLLSDLKLCCDLVNIFYVMIL